MQQMHVYYIFCLQPEYIIWTEKRKGEYGIHLPRSARPTCHPSIVGLVVKALKYRKETNKQTN
jgi:hypothetical protein